jgi:hypothetical protein
MFEGVRNFFRKRARESRGEGGRSRSEAGLKAAFHGDLRQRGIIFAAGGNSALRKRLILNSSKPYLIKSHGFITVFIYLMCISCKKIEQRFSF